MQFLKKTQETCHSEARFIGRGICFFSTAAKQIPRAIVPRFGMRSSFGLNRTIRPLVV
jgi:hypothetical protein